MVACIREIYHATDPLTAGISIDRTTNHNNTSPGTEDRRNYEAMIIDESESDYEDANDEDYLDDEPGDIGLGSLSLSASNPAPYRAALLHNLDTIVASQQFDYQNSSSNTKCTKMQKTPTFLVRDVPRSVHRMCNNRVGDVDPLADDDAVTSGLGGGGACLSALVHAAVDNKMSQVLVRKRGNRLTVKQQEVKALRIATKPGAS